MCGIYGHIQASDITTTNSVDQCLKGLKRLAYRGYDSAGIAGIAQERIISCKTIGKVSALELFIKPMQLYFKTAIAHTRWATHGSIVEKNAHPHLDQHNHLALVHNGIIENYQNLKEMLCKEKVCFCSNTDTEVISQLIAFHHNGSLLTTIKNCLSLLTGSFAFAFIHKNHPKTIFVVAKFCPIVIGRCQKTGDVFVSSDSNAFVNQSLDLFHLYDEEFALLSPKKIQIYNKEGSLLTKPSENFYLETNLLSKNGFNNFLLKEIYEQPDSIQRALANRLDKKNGSVFFEELSLQDERLKTIDRILILACGSSYHAGCIAKHTFASLAALPVEVHIASEFRYEQVILLKNTLVIAISQSGETADTLAALKQAKELGAETTLALCNVKHSTLSRLVSSTLWIQAGPEISVCSTKAFTNQLTLLILLAIKMGRLKTINQAQGKQLLSEVEKLPQNIADTLSQSDKIKQLAEKYSAFHQFFFIGRNCMYPTCLEASLKLKEITYLNACSYPAGEMKHGPIALISENLATVAFCGHTHTAEKMFSNLMEIQARGGPILAFVNEGKKEFSEITEDLIYLPSVSNMLSPIPYSIAGQLFAFHMAVCLNIGDEAIDQPRNLAKSVTVE